MNFSCSVLTEDASWLRKRECFSRPTINLIEILWACVSIAASSSSPGQSFSASVSSINIRTQKGFFKLSPFPNKPEARDLEFYVFTKFSIDLAILKIN